MNEIREWIREMDAEEKKEYSLEDIMREYGHDF